MISTSTRNAGKPGGAPAQARLCALTFDDGPDPEKTALVLDRLQRHRAVATFFVVGAKLGDATAPVVERMVSMGCELGNHSWEGAIMSAMPPEEVRSSVERTAVAIEKYAGARPRFFRPPSMVVSAVMFDTIALPFADGVVGRDWDGCGTGAEQRAANVLQGMRDGAIILLHDVQPDPHPTPEALDILLPELRKQGYELVTLSELFRRKGIEPQPADRRLWKYVE
jgi:peptidoglycan/xylan/chitin deacetylase (PgdA/CDA1 family)